LVAGGVVGEMLAVLGVRWWPSAEFEFEFEMLHANELPDRAVIEITDEWS
jgi:hypothetical protein